MLAFESLSGGQFTLSTQLINENQIILQYSHRNSTTVSLETYPLYQIQQTDEVSLKKTSFDRIYKFKIATFSAQGCFYLTSKKFPSQVSFHCMFFFQKKKRFTDLFLYLHFYTDSS